MNPWLYQQLINWLDSLSTKERDNIDYEKFSRYVNIENHEANEYFKELSKKGLLTEKMITLCPVCKEENSIDLSLYEDKFECSECETEFDIEKQKRHSIILYKLNKNFDMLGKVRVTSQFRENRDKVIDISKIRGSRNYGGEDIMKVKVFLSYSHEDEKMKEKLDKHLIMLKRNEKIYSWNDRYLIAGQKLEKSILEQLESSDIIVLLVSPDFLASDYCYEKEMKIALERNVKGEAIVIPVILRTCDWKNSPLKDLLAVPKDGIPINKWEDEDEAYYNVKQHIEKAIENYFLK